MGLDLKTFVQILKKKDTKNAKEWLEQIRSRVDFNDEFGQGYLLALRGMVAALEAGGELSVINRVVNGEYKQEQVSELVKSVQERLASKFRPKDETGFYTALVEVLQEFSGEMSDVPA